MDKSEMDRPAVVARLIRMAGEIRPGRAGSRPIEPDAPLLSAGFDSIMVITLLRRVEQEFGVGWSGQVPAASFRSLASIADVVVGASRGGPAGVTPAGGTPAG
jgi:acyl carrier protein